MASKQWAVLAAFPVIAFQSERRLRVGAIAIAVAAAVSLPAFALSPSSFVANQLFLAHDRFLSPAALSWLYLLAPRVTLHLAGGLLSPPALRLPATFVGLLHPLMAGPPPQPPRCSWRAPLAAPRSSSCSPPWR